MREGSNRGAREGGSNHRPPYLRDCYTTTGGCDECVSLSDECRAGVSTMWGRSWLRSRGDLTKQTKDEIMLQGDLSMWWVGWPFPKAQVQANSVAEPPRYNLILGSISVPMIVSW
jgi:hypothetical protein